MLFWSFFVGDLAYADDLVLLALTPAMHKMVSYSTKETTMAT